MLFRQYAAAAGSSMRNETGKMDQQEAPIDHWPQCVVKAARRLQIPLHSGPEMSMAFQDAGFHIISTEGIPLKASWTINNGSNLLDFVKQTVKALFRLLVVTGPYPYTEAVQVTDEVVAELEEADCEVDIAAKVLKARKVASCTA